MAYGDVTLNPGTGGATVAVDTITGDAFQRVKLAVGAEGSATDVSTAAPLPVSDAGGSLSIDDGGNVITVDGTVAATQSGTWNVGTVTAVTAITNALPAGTNNIGDVDVLSLPALPAGTNNIGDVDVLSLPALPAGNNNIGDVDVASLPALPSGSNTIGAVRLTDGTDVADVLDLTNSNPLTVAIVDGSGNQVTSFGGSGGTSATDDSAFTAASGAGTPIMGFATADSVDSGDVGVVAMTTARALHVALQNSVPAGTNNIGDVDVLTLPALPAGTNNIGDVDVLSVIPGTGATNLGKAEDAVHTSGDVGVMALAVRQNSQADFGADGDYVPLSVDDNGGVRVSIVAGAGSGGTASADDADFTAGTTQGTPAMGVYESTPTSVTDGDLGTVGITANRELKVNIASGGVSGRAEDSAHSTGHEGIVILAVRRDSASSGVDADGDYATLSTDSSGNLRVTGGGGGTQYNVDVAAGASDTGTLALFVRDDALATLTPADGDYTQGRVNSRGAQWVVHDGALPAGTNNIGDVDVLTLPSIPAGTNNIGDVDILSIAAGDNNIGNVDVVTLPALPAGTNNIGDVDVLTIAAGSNLIGNVGIGVRTSGGATIFRSIDIDETEEEIKATAGQVYFIHATNTATTPRYLKFYNATAANVTVGTTTPVLTFLVPSQGTANGAGFTVTIPMGLAFGTAITVAATTGVADNDTGAPGANEVIVNVGYA